MKNLKLTELEQCELTYVTYKKRLRELEVKAPQLRSEAEKQAIRICKSELRKLKKVIKSFQLPLF